MPVLNPNYRFANLAAYNFAGFACISFAVFILSSQPFYLSEVALVSADKVGKAIGTLGVVDELTAICVAPLVGTLNDRINGWAWHTSRIPAGSRLLELAGFLVLGLSLVGYGAFSGNHMTELYFYRSLFAVGMSSVMSIAVVMLHEANNSDLNWQKVVFWRKRTPSIEEAASLMEEDAVSPPGSLAPETNTHGKLSALLGVSTGLGAIFSVSFFLTLPVRFSKHHDDWSTGDSLRASYSLIGVIGVLCGFIVYMLAYDCVKQRKLSKTDVRDEAPDTGYWQLMREAVAVSVKSRKLQLAYVAGFVSRSTTVATSLFIPLMVYKFYFAQGICGGVDLESGVPLKSDCHDGYIFLAILSGVSLTIMLLSTPAWGIMVDSRRFGASKALLVASMLGLVGSFSLCIMGRGSEVYDPRNAWCFIAVSLIGLSQIGVIIASMSLISKAGRTLQQSEHRVIGGITGLYSLSGGVGILLIAKIGGLWSDRWVFGPFLILGLLNVVLMGFSAAFVTDVEA